MENEIDNFEQEEESLEDDMEEIQKPEKKTSKKKIEDKKPEEKYVPFYQEQRIGILNTVSGEIEIEGFENPVIAKIEAKKLNMLDKIAITSGVQ